MYSILGRSSFCFNYCLNSIHHGGDQFVALLRWYGTPDFFDNGLQLICIFWSLVSHFPLDNTPHIFSMGFRSGEFAGQSSTPIPWSFNQLLMLLAVWAGAESESLKSWSAEVLQNVLINGCSDIGFQKTQQCTPIHHRLWKLHTGLQATWAMSFATLTPDSRTLDLGFQIKYKTFSHLKRRLWTTGQQSSFSSP